MNEQQVARGRRAVACPGWEWMPGMLTRRYSVTGGSWDSLRLTETFSEHHDGFEWLPVLEDPATLGCLVALAREALGEPGAFAVHYDEAWTIERDDGILEGEGLHDGGQWGFDGSGDFISEPTEPDAWLAALEAAGRKDADGV